MASNIFIQHYADGSSKKFRRLVKQGRRKSVLPKATATIAIHTTDAEKIVFRETAKEYGMSESAFGNLVLFLGLKQLSVTDNCSTQ